MIAFVIKCDLCSTTTMFPMAATRTKVREQAKKDGWKSDPKTDLCPLHAARYDQLATRGKNR